MMKTFGTYGATLLTLFGLANHQGYAVSNMWSNHTMNRFESCRNLPEVQKQDCMHRRASSYHK